MNETNSQEEETEEATGGYFGDLIKSFKRSTRKAKFFIELAALVVVILYTCETHRTNRLTERALKQSKQQFADDQRPYIWFVGMRAVPWTTDKKLQENIYFANFGKTPALRQRAIGRIFLGDNARREGHDWIMKMRAGNLDQRDMSVAIIPQGGGITDFVNNGYSVTAYTETVPNKGDVERAMTTNFGLVVVARIEYFGTDPSKRFAADICMERAASGTAGYCHNDENNIQ